MGAGVGAGKWAMDAIMCDGRQSGLQSGRWAPEWAMGSRVGDERQSVTGNMLGDGHFMNYLSLYRPSPSVLFLIFHSYNLINNQNPGRWAIQFFIAWAISDEMFYPPG